MRRLVFLLMSILFVHQQITIYHVSAQHFELDSTEEVSANYVLCVRRVCEYYFRSDHAMKGSLVIMNLTPNPTPFMTTIIASVMEDPNHEFSVMVKDSRKKHMNASHVSEKAQNYFMFCEDAASDVKSTLQQWHKLPTWNPQAQVMVLFTNPFDDDEQMQNDILIALSKFLEHGMLNVNVMIHRANSSWLQVMTWFPYEDDNCATDVRRLVEIDKCEYFDYKTKPDDDLANDIRPKILYFANPKQAKVPGTLHNCPLRVSSSDWAPYSYFNHATKTFERGIEVLLVRTIAGVLRMKTEFYLLSETRENRIVDQPSEGYEQLVNRSAHILIGGMDEDAYTRKQLSSTIPYYQDDQTWCVAVAKPELLWKSFFKLFTPIEWLVIVLMIYMFAVILYVISRIDGRHENIHWSLLSSLSITMGLATVYEPRKISVRFMFLCFLFYGLIFSSTFHSFLVNVLTNPIQKEQVDDLATSAANEFRYAGGTVALAHYEGNDHLAQVVRNRYTLCIMTDDCLEQLHRHDDLAVSSAREHALHSPLISKVEISCFPKTENVYSYSVTMLTQRQFHLLSNINSIIRRVMEFGLIQKWDKDGDTLQLLRLQIASNKLMAGTEYGGDEDGDEAVVLKVDHIMGALILMGCGHALALMTFVVEVLLNLHWVRRRWGWIGRICDRVLDSRRYIYP